ncbi:unnamed protein product [Paramecium pentaurelia]|uniref:Uncharacterized protein n=1 Tax=Paramecium pentaurelia TaxID=43138 RepID=A0A8S1X7M8_9CILI|nr:unnamed protein product [Paramecium pentaurelia]
MNFLLYPYNFQLEQPIPFQTNDFSAKAKEIIDYVISCLGNPNLQVGYQLNGQSALLEPDFDLKQLFDANAQLFIVFNDQGVQQGGQQDAQQGVPQDALQGVQQGVPISVYKLEGIQPTGFLQDCVDTNLQLGQYFNQLIQQQNLIADSFVLYDLNWTALTDDQNLFFGHFGNQPGLNMVLINNQLPQPAQSNNMPQNDINNQGMIPQVMNQINPVQNQNDVINQQYMPQYDQYQQGPIKQQFGLQNTDQQLLNSQNYYNENNEKQQYDSQNQSILSQPQPLPMQQLQPQQFQQQIINSQVVIPIDQQIQQIKDSIVMLKNITLYFDPQGEFITYKYHQPILMSGSIRKTQSSEHKKFLNSKYTWSSIHQNKFEYTQIDEYSFGIKWEGGKSSCITIKQQ